MRRDTATFRMSVLWNLNRKRGTLKLKRNFRGLGLYAGDFPDHHSGLVFCSLPGADREQIPAHRQNFEQALEDDKIRFQS